MNNIIQQLKDNERPFGLMSEEMKLKMQELETEHLEIYQVGDWLDLTQPLGRIQDLLQYTFRLNPDYEDEPEIVEHEIFGVESHLHFRYQGTRHSVCQAYDQPDFIGFKFEDGQVANGPLVYSSKTNIYDFVHLDQIKTGHFTVLHATHVLIRRNKP